MYSVMKTCAFAIVAASSVAPLYLEADCARCQQIEAERAHQRQPTGYYDPSQPNAPLSDRAQVRKNAVPGQKNVGLQKSTSAQITEKQIAMEDDTSSPSSVLQSRPIEGGTSQDEETNPEIRRANQQKYRNFRSEGR